MSIDESVCESCGKPCSYHSDICLCMNCQVETGQFNNGNYQKFYDDMIDAGFEVTAYRGRYFYNGPAVSCDSIQDVVRLTDVDCQWDNLGLGYIVYPK